MLIHIRPKSTTCIPRHLRRSTNHTLHMLTEEAKKRAWDEDHPSKKSDNYRIRRASK